MLIVQNGTILSVYYLLRVSEVIMNSFSPFVAYYRRYFSNLGKYWHRNEMDNFQFGYFYAFSFTMYSIGLIFSSMVPFICLASLYFFYSRHLIDFVNLLTVHGSEIESAGNLINKVLKYNILPIMLYHVAMTSFFLVKAKYISAFIVLCLMGLSIAYWMFKFNTKYILDTYSIHESLKVYEYSNESITENELNKWR
jgi:hypothetical protein